ncbi:MAG: FMN-binding negative transcriptional regulator [Pseudomonadota bacterium]
MHPNPAFRQGADAATLAFIRERSFGMLAVNAEHGPLLSHIPFLLDADGVSADLHLVRSNPILRVLPCDAVIAVTGPDGYVSPDWYDVPDKVPTWNYVAAHLCGHLERLPDDAMHAMLDRQSAGFEQRLPKAPWTTAKMTPDVLRRMMRQIVPCRLRVTKIDSTWKLNQNKPDDVRLRAAAAMETAGIGSETLLLSRLMHNAGSK